MRLGRKRAEARKIDLDADSSLWARPATSLDYEAAHQASAEVLRRLAIGQHFADVYGLALDLAPVLADADAAHGLAQIITLTELGLRCITRWTLQMADGTAASISRQNICELLLDNETLTAVRKALLAPLWEAAAEGNVSPPLHNGASAAGLPIADAAPPTISPAQPENPASTETSAPSA